MNQTYSLYTTTPKVSGADYILRHGVKIYEYMSGYSTVTDAIEAGHKLGKVSPIVDESPVLHAERVLNIATSDKPHMFSNAYLNYLMDLL